MRPLINIITWFESFENVEIIEKSILNAIEELPLEICWYWLSKTLISETLHMDSKLTIKVVEAENKNVGVNKTIETISDGFLYVLDSDNLMHPGFLKKFYELWHLRKFHEQWSGEVFGLEGMVVEQILEDNTHRPIKVRPSCIDSAQYILSRKAIADVRWHDNIGDADGFFIEQVYNSNAKSIKLVEQPLSFYKKAIEYNLLLTSPKVLSAGAVVIPDREYYVRHIKKSLNPILRGTIAHLSRFCDKKFKVLKITGNVVNILPLRVSNHFYKDGSGILLIFENQEHMHGCLKLFEWDLWSMPTSP